MDVLRDRESTEVMRCGGQMFVAQTLDVLVDNDVRGGGEGEDVGVEVALLQL